MVEVGYLPSHPQPESMSDAFYISLALLGGAAISLLMLFLLCCFSRSKVFRELLLRNEVFLHDFLIHEIALTWQNHRIELDKKQWHWWIWRKG